MRYVVAGLLVLVAFECGHRGEGGVGGHRERDQRSQDVLRLTCRSTSPASPFNDWYASSIVQRRPAIFVRGCTVVEGGRAAVATETADWSAAHPLLQRQQATTAL